MVTDTEPRYRLVDANGNVVGSLFAESDGTLKLQEGTSGNDNELSFTTQGELQVEQLSLTALIDEIKSFNANETRAFGTGAGVDVSEPVIPTVIPASDVSGNPGFTIDSVVWNDSSGELRWSVSEVNGTASDARFILWKITP